MKRIRNILQHLGNTGRVFLMLVMTLLTVGLIMLLSASYPSAYYETGDSAYYFKRQLCFAVLGVASMLTMAALDYSRLRTLARPAMVLAILLLALVLIPGIGVMRNNARRWISVAGLFTLQPSELAKLTVVIALASSIAVKKDRMRSWRDGIRPHLLFLLTVSGLVLAEPHLSGALLILGTGAVLLFVGGIRMRWVIGAGLTAVLGAWTLLNGVFSYGQSRIAVWQDPFSDAGGAGYQLSQSLLAIGSGGLTGLGLGRSRQKFLFLPEEHNDFIFFHSV